MVTMRKTSYCNIPYQQNKEQKLHNYLNRLKRHLMKSDTLLIKQKLQQREKKDFLSLIKTMNRNPELTITFTGERRKTIPL